jgi:hypothetical protein
MEPTVMGTEPRKVLIFTGAGVGVPLGLPTTTNFSDEVKNQASSITLHLVKYLGAGGNDVESILSSLESFSKDTAFTDYLLPQLTPKAHTEARQNLQRFKIEAAREIMRIKKIIFTKLARFDPQKTCDLYLNLITEVREVYPDCSIAFFTTNYDLTFESSIESASAKLKSDLGIERVEFGFSINFGRAIYDSAIDFRWDPKVIEFSKLHGSLDWHRDAQENCTRAGSSITPDNPEEMPILYPGYKGIPEIEPFATLHGRLHQRLTQADAVIVIGFAMRDAYINSIFDNVLRSRSALPVFCFNPVPLDACPSDSRLPDFVRSHHTFRHILKGIEVADKPLDLIKYMSA